jgi:hypothetical protein
MSSSVSTNQGPREGAGSSGPQSSQGLSSMLDGPYTLPVADMKRTVDVKSQAKKLLRKVMYPHLCSY